jgi:hypothetical protein
MMQIPWETLKALAIFLGGTAAWMALILTAAQFMKWRHRSQMTGQAAPQPLAESASESL